jgi:GT2 family glycosyltransferase
MVEINNARQLVTPARLHDAIADQLSHRLIDVRYHDRTLQPELSYLQERTGMREAPAAPALPASIMVSVVLATHDRPGQLRECLQALTQQHTPRQVELIVVDNNPASGLTAPVVNEFPAVTLLAESRKGSSYARNAGIVHASGDIIAITDDDVVVPATWVEKLIRPFERTDIGAVTGNVLPRELDTEAQYLFEIYGGLGRGFKKLEYGPSWFRARKRRAVPTWNLGATANAAFRSDVFRDPRIGLMDEALGAGMPCGVGEDTLLFYRIIKAGYSLAYEPDAYVWHTHRRDRKSLRKQIYNYSKGHVGYHLTTWLHDGDHRGLFRVLVELPRSHLRRLYSRLRRRSDYPIPLILLEIGGNLAGPWALWQSRRQVRQQGRSAFPNSHDMPETQASN